MIFNAHLATLSSYLENRQIKDAQDYIATLREHQTDRILIANTHNSTIDALLNQKAQVAKKNNIDIRFKVNDLSGTKVAPMDLVIIIGNLLDNAIEACLKLPAGEREIYAQLFIGGDAVSVFPQYIPAGGNRKRLHCHDQKSRPTCMGLGFKMSKPH